MKKKSKFEKWQVEPCIYGLLLGINVLHLKVGFMS